MTKSFSVMSSSFALARSSIRISRNPSLTVNLLLENFDNLTLNQRFNAKKSLKINQKFSFSTRRQYFAFLTACRTRCTGAGDCRGVAPATGYKMTWRKWVVTMLPRELRRKWFREMGHFFGCLGLIDA